MRVVGRKVERPMSIYYDQLSQQDDDVMATSYLPDDSKNLQQTVQNDQSVKIAQLMSSVLKKYKQDPSTAAPSTPTKPSDPPSSPQQPEHLIGSLSQSGSGSE